MINMERFLFLIIGLFMLSGLPTTQLTGQSKADASAIIEKTSRIYKDWGGMDVKFTSHSRDEKNSTSESFEGAMRMKNEKFVLTTPDMIIWFDGTTQWTYLPYNKEVNINTPSADELHLINPMMLLQDYKKNYNLTLTGESTSANAKSAFDITLTPKKREQLEKVDIQIEKNTSLPVKLVITMRNKIFITVMLNEMKADNPSDELFTFPKPSYPDVEIIDLR